MLLVSLVFARVYLYVCVCLGCLLMPISMPNCLSELVSMSCCAYVSVSVHLSVFFCVSIVQHIVLYVRDVYFSLSFWLFWLS